MRYMITAGLAVFMAAGTLISCSDTNEPAVEGTGTLRMILVDAPPDIGEVDSLIVVFDEVLVHRGCESEEECDGEWVTVLSDTLPVENRTFDLLELVNGVFAVLGEVELDAALYSQVRIMYESATLYIGGESQDLFIPSGNQTGIKLVNAFEVDPNVITELIVDFDVAESLHEAPPGSGNYILRPTIRLVENVLSGTISGTVTPVGIGAVVYALDPATADTVTSTMPDPDTGGYVLQALLAGTYDVMAAAEGYVDSTRTGITVDAGANTPGIDFDLVPVAVE